MNKMKCLLPDNNNQSGQVVLITLLILAVVLTISLSIVSRSITTVKTSQQSQESARAFWVAQGELDKAIRANSGHSGISSNGVVSEVTRVEMGGSDIFIYPEPLRSDYSATVWLVDHNPDGTIDPVFTNPDGLTIYWGDNPANTTALEVTVAYFDTNYKLARYTFDPDKVNTGSGFGDPDVGNIIVGSKSFAFSKEIDLSDPQLDNIYFVRLRFIGNAGDDSLAVKISSDDPNLVLPSQGSCFESTSKVEASGISRKLTSCQLWQTYPAVFDNALFTNTSIQ